MNNKTQSCGFIKNKDLYIETLERALNNYRIELKDSANLLEKLISFINAVPDAIYFKDERGRWLFVNDAGLALFNLRGIDFRDKTEKDFVDLIEGPYRDFLLHCAEVDRDVSEKGKILRRDEFLTLSDGTKKIYDFIRTPLFYIDGSQKGFAVFARDVTEQRRMEDEIKQKNEQLTTMAITDALTGIYNRRHLITRFKEEFEKARRHLSNLSCILIDIDKFKYVNDNYGHLIGDEVIKKACNIIRDSVRVYDIVGRFGGEEFLIILPDTKIEESLRLAERLRAKVESDLAIYNSDGHWIRTTISLGLTTFNDRDLSIDDMLKRADDALYMAKKGGRNRVQCGDVI